MLNKKAKKTPEAFIQIKKLFRQVIGRAYNYMKYNNLVKANLLTYLFPPYGRTGIDTLFINYDKNRLSRLQRASPSAFLDKYVKKELPQR